MHQDMSDQRKCWPLKSEGCAVFVAVVQLFVWNRWVRLATTSVTSETIGSSNRNCRINAATTILDGPQHSQGVASCCRMALMTRLANAGARNTGSSRLPPPWGASCFDLFSFLCRGSSPCDKARPPMQLCENMGRKVPTPMAKPSRKRTDADAIEAAKGLEILRCSGTASVKRKAVHTSENLQMRRSLNPAASCGWPPHALKYV